MQMKLIIELLFTGFTSLIMAIIFIPVLRKIAVKIGLVDMPNYRKVHSKAVPLVGGIAIVLSSILTLSISNIFMSGVIEHSFILGAGIILMITGVIDDKMNINAFIRLAIQFSCAYAMASSGIKITSLYGVFGVYELPVIWQYFLTIVIITGVVNAYNLMDGIDGLAGGLAIVGFSTLSVLFYMLGQYDFVILFVAIIGAIIGFLKFNLSNNKIYLGDGGSLFLGFILVVSGIKLIEMANAFESITQSTALVLVIGIFLLPVLDSLRVYRKRIKSGVSPFKADKSHLHHLFLQLGISHKFTAILITSSSLFLLVFSFILVIYFSLTWVLIIGAFTFLWFTSILVVNKKVKEWSDKIRKMERE
jgi:UDP-GlcNAc:undecaprenyl-phosphate GlcNAc-1-phosphate transferase